MRAATLLSNILYLPLRVLVFAIGWFAWWMESAADWLVGARGATEYVRTGSCNRCGRCCRLLALELPRSFLKHPLLVRFFAAWHRAAMNFEPRGQADTMLVYRCRHFREDEKGRGCSIYPFRHRLCRFFPRQALYGHPELAAECGFRFVRRDVLARRKIRERASFDEQLRRLQGPQGR